MRTSPVLKTTHADSSARTLVSTVVTLGCAFLLVLGAAVAVVLAIADSANIAEAERQRDRIEAAIDNQGRLRQLRLESLASNGVLQAALHPSVPPEALQWAFQRMSHRFVDFDGAFLVTLEGKVIAGVEHKEAAGQERYDALKRLDAGLPGAPAGARPQEPMQYKVISDGARVLALISADLTRLLGLQDGANGGRTIALVGYRVITQEALDELARRYRVANLRVVATQPVEALQRRPIMSADGATRAWLTWTPDHPGDTMMAQFTWVLLGAGLVFAAILLYAVRRLRNAADEIRLREVQIQRLAGQDELSLLPNRRTFDLRLEQELAQLSRSETGLAVLLIDLDRFKAVNDTYGHTAGDELIRQVGGRLQHIMRAGDTVARLGGDEFGIIQTNLDEAGGSANLGERILETLAEPYNLLGIETTIGCSIGIALAPQDGNDRETLLRLADTALYQAKNEGRNRYSFFEARMNRALHLKRMVEEDLRKAIARDELVLHYQPQVSIDGTTIVGVEALVRWQHPVHGMVPPSEFISIAEERGLIVPLSEWVLRRACLEAKRWQGIKLAVNVSPIQFRHKDFVGNVIRIVEETGFDPAMLELELTEGVVVDDADAAENAMMDLRAHGIGLSLDDFGTGYSSLIYLRRFAFDKIKIDRSFLEYMEATGESAILVHSVVHLGRALGLRVCAEGVETVEQHRFLQAIGCHELQGFLFSKGVEPAEIDRLLTLDEPFAANLAAASLNAELPPAAA